MVAEPEKGRAVCAGGVQLQQEGVMEQPGRWHSALCIAAEPVLAAAVEAVSLSDLKRNALPSYGKYKCVAILTLPPQERLLQFFLRLQSSLKPLALLCGSCFGVTWHTSGLQAF